MQIYYFILYFFIYGFLGWCTEVAYATVKQKKFVNRGFLNGPICPVYGVGIGMVVSERHGRIFGGNNLGSYKAGMTAHNSGEYAKTVKSDYPAICAPKSVLAEYTLRALDIGLVPGRDISCSPAVLMLARAYGKPIALDNIKERAWIELESVGITKAFLKEPNSSPMTREKIVANADSIIPGMPGAKKFKVSDICEIRYAEI